MNIIFQSAWDMRAIRLESGHLGLAQEGVEENDGAVVFLGTKAPLVVRKVTSNPECYEIVGPAHVSGMIEGQAMEKPGVPCRKYVLV